MEKIKCEECGAYNGHSPLCTKNTLEETKQHLAVYFEAFQNFSKRRQEYERRCQLMVNKFIKEAQFWQGKYSTVKLENNQIRKNVI